MRRLILVCLLCLAIALFLGAGLSSVLADDSELLGLSTDTKVSVQPDEQTATGTLFFPNLT